MAVCHLFLPQEIDAGVPWQPSQHHWPACQPQPARSTNTFNEVSYKKFHQSNFKGGPLALIFGKIPNTPDWPKACRPRHARLPPGTPVQACQTGPGTPDWAQAAGGTGTPDWHHARQIARACHNPQSSEIPHRNLDIDIRCLAPLLLPRLLCISKLL